MIPARQMQRIGYPQSQWSQRLLNIRYPSRRAEMRRINPTQLPDSGSAKSLHACGIRRVTAVQPVARLPDKMSHATLICVVRCSRSWRSVVLVARSGCQLCRRPSTIFLMAASLASGLAPSTRHASSRVRGICPSPKAVLWVSTGSCGELVGAGRRGRPSAVPAFDQTVRPPKLTLPNSRAPAPARLNCSRRRAQTNRPRARATRAANPTSACVVDDGATAVSVEGPGDTSKGVLGLAAGAASILGLTSATLGRTGSGAFSVIGVAGLAGAD